MSKARNLAALLGGGSSGVIQFGGTGAIQVPGGTTAQRPTAAVGEIRYNSDTGYMETYTSSGWTSVASPPIVLSTNVNNVDESATTQTIVISGSNFDSGAVAVLVTSGGVTKIPTTSTRNSSSQITITFTGGDLLTAAVPEPLDVKVINSSGLTSTLAQAIYIDATPVWSSPSIGNIATIYEGVAMSSISLVATDSEGSTPTFSITSGALPTGVSLSGSTISGTSSAGGTYASGGTTYNFTVGASDGTGNTTPRSFNIIRKWLDGSTSAQATTSAAAIKALTSTTSNGYYWIKPSGYGGSAQQVWCDMTNNDGGWMLLSFCGTDVWNNLHVADSSTSAFNMGSTSTSIISTSQTSGTYGNAGQSFIDSLVVAGRSRGIGMFRVEDAGTTFFNWYFSVDANARYLPLSQRHNANSNNSVNTTNDGLSGNTWLKSCYLTWSSGAGNSGAGTLSGTNYTYGGTAWGTYPCNINGNTTSNWGYAISPLYDNGLGPVSEYASCHSSGWNRRGSFWLRIV